MDPNIFQYLITGMVSCVVAYFSYLTVKERVRGNQHDRELNELRTEVASLRNKVRVLEQEAAKCAEDRERDAIIIQEHKEFLDEVWPSDADSLWMKIMEVKDKMKQAGKKLTARDVVLLIRQFRKGASNESYF